MRFVRSIVEHVSRGVVLRRRLPARFGNRPLLVTPDSRLAYWRWNLERVEPNLFSWVDDIVEKGMTVWDIGANVGLFSLAAAVKSGAEGEVVAVEPDLRLASLVRRSYALGHCESEAPLIVAPVAASEGNELVKFNLSRRGRASNYVSKFEGGTQAGGARRETSTMAVTLDWLVGQFRAPELIKIDVEGGELAVLRGAREIIHDYRPQLLIEVYKRNRKQVEKLLTSAGYRFFDATESPLNTQTPIGTPVLETYCLPGESI